MQVEDVLAAIRTLREQGADNLDVEAKASKTALPRSVKESVCAFANTNGGLILLGVAEEDGFEVVGVDDPAKIASDLAAAFNDLEPIPRPSIQMFEVEGRWVVVAEVPELDASEKPCYVVARGMSRGSYIRVHDGDNLLSNYEVQLLLSNRGQPVHDTEIVPEATVSVDLDGEAVRAYATRVRDLRPQLTRGLTDEQILSRQRLAALEGGQLRPTLAGLLSLGVYPQQFFPQLMLTLVVYPTPEGPDLDSGTRFLDNVAVEGSIPVVAREALAAIKRNMRRRSVVAGVGRSETWEYPEAALREAIVNALVHREDLQDPPVEVFERRELSEGAAVDETHDAFAAVAGELVEER